jgi:hypothetical protein
MVERAEYHFEVKEYTDEKSGYPRFRIVAVPAAVQLPQLSEVWGFLAFELAGRPSRAEADDIARTLNDSISALSFVRY